MLPNQQVHGVVALSTGGGDLHLAPGEDTAKKGFTILDMLFQSFQQWNVSHEVHKIRFGPEHPAGVYQLDGRTKVIEDTYGMYQYYFQVSTASITHCLSWCSIFFARLFLLSISS